MKKQGVTRHDGFMKRQRIYGVTKLEDHDINLEEVKDRLKERRYQYIRERKTVIYLEAEKGRFSRWGPYVNHIGLIIFLIGALLAFRPWDVYRQSTLAS